MSLVTNTITIEQKKYTDIDMNFTMNIGNNDIYKKNDEEAIKQSIKNLIMLKPFDRPFNPMLSSQVSELLFELWTPLTKISMKRVINDVLEAYEPRIKVENIDISDQSDRNEINVTLYFTIVNTSKKVQYSILLSRIR